MRVYTYTRAPMDLIESRCMQSSLGFRLGLGVHKAIRWYYTAGKVRHIGIVVGRQVDYGSLWRDSARFGAPDCFWVVKLPRKVLCGKSVESTDSAPITRSSEADLRAWRVDICVISDTGTRSTGWRVHSLHITSHLQAWTGRPQIWASFCLNRWRRDAEEEVTNLPAAAALQSL